jgi:hypothetical protein
VRVWTWRVCRLPFVLRFYCPNGLRQVDLFANKFRRAERKRITLNPVTAGPGELGIWKAETRTHLMSRQGEPLRLHANDVTGLPGSHLKKTGFKTIWTVPPTRFKTAQNPGRINFLLTQSLKRRSRFSDFLTLVTCGTCCARPGARQRSLSEPQAASETSTGSPQRCRWGGHRG